MPASFDILNAFYTIILWPFWTFTSISIWRSLVQCIWFGFYLWIGLFILFFYFFSIPTLGNIQQNRHPGFVPSAKPQLPTPKDATYSRPQASETFKVIIVSRYQQKVTNETFL